ncbi:MAG: RNA polymerase sigma factor [Candidatus Solibacter sp.]
MDLLLAARRGDEGAFSQLYEEHHLPVFRYAYRMTGSAADADDVVQECFFQLLRPSASYNPERSGIRLYLLGIARNLVLKRWRRGKLASAFTLQPAASHSPERQVLQNEMERVIAGAILALPETLREVLILSHYEQMPLAEIADLMSLNPGAAKSRLQRGRARLKESLADYAPRTGASDERRRTR